ncbi:MAG: YciI family protein [Proteobacteria bacterium]|nr:YciI family protein [Pseudomonadota bacterium]
MLFVIRALDALGASAKRQEVYKAHFTHLDGAEGMGVKIIMSGPLVSEDDKKPLGSLFIVDAKDRATAEAFNRADPFFKQGVWKKVDIHAFDKRRG